MYGAQAAALFTYSVVMLGALDPGFKFDTFWNSAVVANFIVGIIASLPLAVMFIVVYIMPEDYMMNYIFLFMSFINSWHLISSFWISVALMIVSTILETPDQMKDKKVLGQIPEDTKLRPEDYLAYMIVNIGLGGGATAVTYMYKQKLFAWFIFTFPDQLPEDDLMQEMNKTLEGTPIFDVKKGINADTIGGIQKDPKGTIEKATGEKLPEAPKLPELPKFKKVEKDEWEYDF